MATGIIKGEVLSQEALIADNPDIKSSPLPDNNEDVLFDYSHKLSRQEILKGVNHKYCLIKESGEVKGTRKIPINSFLLADNYYALKKMLKNYSGSVQLIYIDPPYGTGRQFQSRQLKHAYKDMLGTAAWLEFLRRRLILMRELMSNDASIYVHIGHQMLFHLKVIMDEVFGANNFRNLITRKKCSSKNFTKNQYPNLNDYILFYTKSNSYIWNQPGLPAHQDWIIKEYPKMDEKGRYKLVPIHAPGTRNGKTGKKWRGLNPPAGKHWQFSPAKLDELDKIGEIHWSKNGNPRRKVYLTQDKSLPLTDYWDNYRDAHHQSIKISGYPTEKNINMLKMIVGASSNPGDLILDPFCGSGATLNAANDLDRKWIGIDESFISAEAVIKRLRHGLAPMGDYVNPESRMDDLFEREKIQNTVSKTSMKLNFLVDETVFNNYRNEIFSLALI